ncbi:preprotein translocase, YajC subunit [Peptoanaerobacter stomatis]|uniref:Preprotein translocase, YajC subunit n=1 Tax=Peptoanaerobacter stomatis TaxID=796937 RepID=V9HP88_9FIRM|nr:preprotein translocase subunit YajC [Peptoanaerobacter stomatis]EHL17055.1 preprotein translocase, YajC subunit [Peptoanaerobacter stomatis]
MANTGANAAGSLGMFFPLILMGFFLYFFVMKPQKKRQKEVMDMRSSLKVGDTVILYSGLIGLIIEIKDDTMVLECAPDNTHLTFKNWSVREVVINDTDDDDEIEEDDEDIEIDEEK